MLFQSYRSKLAHSVFLRMNRVVYRERDIYQRGVLGDVEGGGSGDEEKTKGKLNRIELKNG
jgi:hypothetical protein